MLCVVICGSIFKIIEMVYHNFYQIEENKESI